MYRYVHNAPISKKDYWGLFINNVVDSVVATGLMRYASNTSVTIQTGTAGGTKAPFPWKTDSRALGQVGFKVFPPDCKQTQLPGGCWAVEFIIYGYLVANVVPDNDPAWAEYLVDMQFPQGHPIWETLPYDRVKEAIKHEMFHYDSAVGVLTEAESVAELEMSYATKWNADIACECGKMALSKLMAKWRDYQTTFDFEYAMEMYYGNPFPPEESYYLKGHDTFWDVFFEDAGCFAWYFLTVLKDL